MKAALNQRCCSYVESSLTMHNRLIFCSFLLVDSVNMVGMLITLCTVKSKKADKNIFSGAPTNMVNLFSFGCHVIDRAYVRTYSSTDCTGRVGEAIRRKGGVSQGCLGKSTSFTLDIYNMVQGIVN